MVYPTTIRSERPSKYQYAWIPVLCGMAAIFGESTQTMGGGHTSVWLLDFINIFHKQTATNNFEQIHLVLRKTGHFTGYGLLGVMFARAWASQLQRRFMMTWSAVKVRGAALGVLCAFMVASMDEFHQSFLPGRSSSFHDVMLDTSGALVLNAIFFALLLARRRRVMEYLSEFRASRMEVMQSGRAAQTASKHADSFGLAA